MPEQVWVQVQHLAEQQWAGEMPQNAAWMRLPRMAKLRN